MQVPDDTWTDAPPVQPPPVQPPPVQPPGPTLPNAGSAVPPWMVPLGAALLLAGGVTLLYARKGREGETSAVDAGIDPS